MFSTYGLLLRTPVHPRLTSAYPPKVIGALVVASLAAGMILSLPDASSSSPNLPATSPAPQRSEDSAAGDLACGRQTWPYLDQRCAEPAAKTPGQATHQVRVVSTDRGTSSTIVTAVASDPPKPPADISRLRESAAKLQSPDPQKNPAADAKQNLVQNIVAMTASVQDFPPQTMAVGSGRRVIVSQKYNAQDEGEIVTVSSPRSRGQRVYLVPRESIEANSGW